MPSESSLVVVLGQPLLALWYIRKLFGLANAGIVYSRMLNVAMKDMDMEFLDILPRGYINFQGEPWAHLGHLAQVVRAHAAAGGIKI